jgi:hypothetical protein
VANAAASEDPSTDTGGRQIFVGVNTLVIGHFDPGHKTAELNYLVLGENYSQVRFCNAFSCMM